MILRHDPSALGLLVLTIVCVWLGCGNGVLAADRPPGRCTRRGRR